MSVKTSQNCTSKSSAFSSCPTSKITSKNILDKAHTHTENTHKGKHKITSTNTHNHKNTRPQTHTTTNTHDHKHTRPKTHTATNTHIHKHRPMYTSLVHLIPAVPMATSEKPTVAPTMLCVPLTGILKRVARTSHRQEPVSWQGDLIITYF